MSYEVLKVDAWGKADLCYIPEDTFHDKHDIYEPINKKYHNISLATPLKHHNKYEEPLNDTINTMFPEYGGCITGNVYLILDLEQKPHELERQYKRLIVDVAYKRFL